MNDKPKLKKRQDWPKNEEKSEMDDIEAGYIRYDHPEDRKDTHSNIR